MKVKTEFEKTIYNEMRHRLHPDVDVYVNYEQGGFAGVTFSYLDVKMQSVFLESDINQPDYFYYAACKVAEILGRLALLT